MKITEIHGASGQYINLVGKGYDLSIRMEQPTAVSSLMYAAAEARAKQFRLQGLAEILEDAAASLLESERSEQPGAVLAPIFRSEP